MKRAVRSGRGPEIERVPPGECAAISESVRRRLCAEWMKGDLPRERGSRAPTPSCAPAELSLRRSSCVTVE